MAWWHALVELVRDAEAAVVAFGERCEAATSADRFRRAHKRHRCIALLGRENFPAHTYMPTPDYMICDCGDEWRAPERRAW